VCQDEENRNYLGSNVSIFKKYDGSRLKIMGLKALPTYKE